MNPEQHTRDVSRDKAGMNGAHVDDVAGGWAILTAGERCKHSCRIWWSEAWSQSMRQGEELLRAVSRYFALEKKGDAHGDGDGEAT